MIRIENVSKTYAGSGVRALDRVSFEVPPGEIFGFLGPNGAGKTTAIKVLCGIVRADEGRALVGGFDLATQSFEAKRNIGYVTDNPELFAKLRAKEYLNFIGDVFEVETELRRQRILTLARRFEIADVLDNSIGSFSHGMKQKLMITVSLLSDPENWILDEPIVGLDPRAAFQLKELMRERANSGKTVFFSTHVMEVAERLCDRLAIIDKGRIVFVGTLAQLRAARGKDGTLEELFLALTDGTGGDGELADSSDGLGAGEGAGAGELAAAGAAGEGADTTPPPDTAAATPPPDTAAATPPPDTAAAIPPPDTAAAIPPPDTAAAIPPPDTAAATPPPDTAAATPPPDATAATPPPDATAATPPPDTAPEADR